MSSFLIVFVNIGHVNAADELVHWERLDVLAPLVSGLTNLTKTNLWHDLLFTNHKAFYSELD